MFCAVANAALAADSDEDWKLKRDRDGVQVYTAGVNGSPYDAVMSRVVVEGLSLSSLVAVVKDAATCPEWTDLCAESYVYKQISETEEMVYIHNDLPFPVKDRDVLAHVVWQQNPSTLVVSMHSKAESNILPEQKGRVRLVDAETTWKFTPDQNGSIEIESWAHINPGSNLPSWITNMLLVDTPFVTIQALVELARKPEYAAATYAFVAEPT